MYTFITESKLLKLCASLKCEFCHVKDFILGINDNGVRDLAHSLYPRDLVLIASHPRDKLIEKLDESKWAINFLTANVMYIGTIKMCENVKSRLKNVSSYVPENTNEIRIKLI